jgi:hypothetical protein
MRRFFQFGLRGLIVAVALVSIAVGWLAVRLREADRQRSAIAAIVSSGGTVEYAHENQVDESGNWIPAARPPGPAWLRRLLGDDFFARAYNVTFFHQTELTNADLSQLATLKKLNEVAIIEGRITDDGLDVIGRLTNLKWLRLCEVPITDAGLARLEPLENLESLDLAGTQITDMALAHVAAFRRLRLLDLTRTRITDDGMKHLSAMPNLQVLNISLTEVSGAGLPPLMQLKRLKHITLGGTRVTADGERQLQQSLPDCQITWWTRRN